MAAKFTSLAGLEAWVIENFYGSRQKATENFKRARALIAAGSVPAAAHEVQAVEGTDGIKISACTIAVAGTSPQPYTVHVELQGRAGADWEGAQVSCSCPAGQKTPCKHGLAVLLMQLGLDAEMPDAQVPSAAAIPVALPSAVLVGGRMLPGTLQLGGAQLAAKRAHGPPASNPADQPPARKQK